MPNKQADLLSRFLFFTKASNLLDGIIQIICGIYISIRHVMCDVVEGEKQCCCVEAVEQSESNKNQEVCHVTARIPHFDCGVTALHH